MKIGEIENLGSSKTASNLNIGESLALPVANSIEGIFLNLSINRAYSVVTLELTINGKRSDLWLGANLINSSDYVGSTVGLDIISKNAGEATIMLPVEKPGSYILNINYNMQLFTELDLTLKLVSVEKANLSKYEFDSYWNVWRGKIVVK